MIKWSDGSMSLLIGEEMFLINSHDISKQHTFLGVPNVHSNSIENHARLTNQITFRPDSNSRTHKRLSAAIQARNVKQVKTKFVEINDPKLIELQLQVHIFIYLFNYLKCTFILISLYHNLL